MIKAITFIMLSIALLSCNLKKRGCSSAYFENIDLWPVNVTLKVPSYKIVDSTRFGSENILNYRASSTDSTLKMYFTITSYKDIRPIGIDITHEMSSQKHTSELGWQTTKLIELFKIVDTTKIGCLKYLKEKDGKKIYEGKMFFFRGKQLVEVWLLEKYLNEEQKGNSVIDCIFESVKLN